MPHKTISIIIPAYNEAKTIAATLAAIDLTLQEANMDYEIIVVNDGSMDATDAIIKDYSRKNEKIKIIGYEKNQGKGYAIKYGISHAKGELIAFMDADLDIDPSYLLIFLKALEERSADAVIGSKRQKGSIDKYRPKRKIFSRTYTFILNILFKLPVDDTQTGMKLFKSKPLKEVIHKLTINKFAFDLELILLLSKAGYKIVEERVTINPSRQKGRIRVKDAIIVLLDTIRIFFRLHFKKSF